MEIKTKVRIGDKNYSARTLEILTGEKNINPTKIEDEYLLIAEAIDNPNDFPFLVARIYDISADEDLRLGLVRMQIGSKLNMKEDLEAHNTRLYVAESIEKLLFGDLLLEGNGKKEESAKKKDKEKSKKPRKRGRPKGNGGKKKK